MEMWSNIPPHSVKAHVHIYSNVGACLISELWFVSSAEYFIFVWCLPLICYTPRFCTSVTSVPHRHGA